MEFRKHTLDNGLQIVAECNPEAHTTAVAFLVNTGARDETPQVSGVSHFLEHMVFKGTATRTADEVNGRFDALGADYNAWTGKENTTYHAVVLPEYQDQIVELWADLMRPALREDDFETEKQVIIEEIRMYADQPPFTADEKCEQSHYGKHPLGNSVLGTVDSVSNLTVDAMRNYFREQYSPQNIVLAAAGRVDFDALCRTAKDSCGKWRQLDVHREVAPPAPHEGFELMEKEAASQEYIIQLCNGPPSNHPQRFAAHLLVNLLGDSSGSRLYWELLHPGLAEQASTHYYEYDGAGLFMTWICCVPDTAAENIQRVLDLYRGAAKEGFRKDEIERAKTKFRSRLVLASERPHNRMLSVGMNWLRRREYRSVKIDLDEYNAVTADDIASVLSQYPLTASTSIAVGPLTKLDPAV